MFTYAKTIFDNKNLLIHFDDHFTFFKQAVDNHHTVSMANQNLVKDPLGSLFLLQLGLTAVSQLTRHFTYQSFLTEDPCKEKEIDVSKIASLAPKVTKVFQDITEILATSSKDPDRLIEAKCVCYSAGFDFAIDETKSVGYLIVPYLANNCDDINAISYLQIPLK